MNNIENKLREVYNSLTKEYNFEVDSLKIIISSRLRCSNGRARVYKDFLDRITARIVMSKPLLDEFGWESFELTFRHEVAHIANYVLFNGKYHDITFKRLCEKFGGGMNAQMAGDDFKDCASVEFIKTIKRWSYTCPCGVVALRAKRMSWKKRTHRTHVCRSCHGSVVDWVEKELV